MRLLIAGLAENREVLRAGLSSAAWLTVWEAIVLDRKDDMLTLRFRDYPRLPKFPRHRTAVARMSPAADQ